MKTTLENTKSEYDTQAETFLAKHGLKFRATLSDSKTPSWSEPRMKTCPTCKGRGETCNPQEKAQTVYEQRRGLNNPTYSTCKECRGKKEVHDKEAIQGGHHYRVTISRSIPGTNADGARYEVTGTRLTFDFFGSISDAEKGIVTVKPYDVLACISSDAYTPETFADFCAEFGYEKDSIKALQTFRRCDRFAKRLRAFFTSQELEDLSQIQ